MFYSVIPDGMFLELKLSFNALFDPKVGCFLTYLLVKSMSGMILLCLLISYLQRVLNRDDCVAAPFRLSDGPNGSLLAFLV